MNAATPRCLNATHQHRAGPPNASSILISKARKGRRVIGGTAKATKLAAGWLGQLRPILGRIARCLTERFMEKPVLLTVCAVLFAFGIFTIAVSSGFFMQLLGAIVMALGGSAAYLMLSRRDPEAPRK
jgi:hypothetical protein